MIGGNVCHSFNTNYRPVTNATLVASPGSRWRYRVTWSDNTTALSTTPLGDVLLAMGTVGCKSSSLHTILQIVVCLTLVCSGCALVDNPQAWLDGTESILLDFGEVAKPVGYDKAKCQNTNIQRELATRWKCDVGSGDNSDVKCA